MATNWKEIEMHKAKDAKKLVRTAKMDPQNSVSLFDRNRRNEFGELYCVACAILRSEVDWYWEQYVDLLHDKEIEAEQKANDKHNPIER
jgi:hypothetical protein